MQYIPYFIKQYVGTCKHEGINSIMAGSSRDQVQLLSTAELLQ